MTLFRNYRSFEYKYPYEGEETVSIHLYYNIPMQRSLFVRG